MCRGAINRYECSAPVRGIPRNRAEDGPALLVFALTPPLLLLLRLRRGEYLGHVFDVPLVVELAEGHGPAGCFAAFELGDRDARANLIA